MCRNEDLIQQMRSGGSFASSFSRKRDRESERVTPHGTAGHASTAQQKSDQPNDSLNLNSNEAGSSSSIRLSISDSSAARAEHAIHPPAPVASSPDAVSTPPRKRLRSESRSPHKKRVATADSHDVAFTNSTQAAASVRLESTRTATGHSDRSGARHYSDSSRDGIASSRDRDSADQRSRDSSSTTRLDTARANDSSRTERPRDDAKPSIRHSPRRQPLRKDEDARTSSSSRVLEQQRTASSDHGSARRSYRSPDRGSDRPDRGARTTTGNVNSNSNSNSRTSSSRAVSDDRDRNRGSGGSERR